MKTDAITANVPLPWFTLLLLVFLFALLPLLPGLVLPASPPPDVAIELTAEQLSALEQTYQDGFIPH